MWILDSYFVRCPTGFCWQYQNNPSPGRIAPGSMRRHLPQSSQRFHCDVEGSPSSTIGADTCAGADTSTDADTREGSDTSDDTDNSGGADTSDGADTSAGVEIVAGEGW